MLARLGGDEFLILLPDLAAEEAEAAARRAADEVAARLAEPFKVSGAVFHVHASIGISLFPDDAQAPVELLQHADMAMYQSKGRGRAASTVFAHVAQDPLERLSLPARLRRAIAGNELVLHYQPIVELQTGRLASMEALLRWNDPDRGLVYPDDFIPAAEEMSLLEPIGDWVIGAIAAAGARVARAGPAAARELQRLAAPAAPARLRAPSWPRGWPSSSIEPSWLTMELTESATLREPERIGPILRELNEAGLRLAIDDFGAGWSSLARLRQLPVRHAQDRPLVPARDPRGSGSRCNCRCSHRPRRRARHGHGRRGRGDPRSGAVPGRAGLPARPGPLVRRPRPGGRADRGTKRRVQRLKRGALGADECPMEPQRSLRVLLADVPEPDAIEIAEALEKAGWTVHARRTTGGDGLEAALLDRGWDAVLFGGEGDAAVPARKALALVRLADPHLPFVAITRSVRRDDLAAVVKGLEAGIAVAAGPVEVAETLQRELAAARTRRAEGRAHRLLLAQQAITDHLANGQGPGEPDGRASSARSARRSASPAARSGCPRATARRCAAARRGSRPTPGPPSTPSPRARAGSGSRPAAGCPAACSPSAARRGSPTCAPTPRSRAPEPRATRA